MAVPEVVPIAHEPDHRTDTIGRYADGQFLATITYAVPDDGGRRLYGALHLFDAEGRHTASDVWCAGTWDEQHDAPRDGDSPLARARSRMSALLDALPRRAYGDIAVRPFHVTFDGVLFGLVTERHGEGEGEHDWAELLPDHLGFGAPWDGRYDT